TLVTCGHDGTMRLWDVPDIMAADAARHEASVVGLAFSADGQRLATRSLDGTARVWGAPTWRELARLSVDQTHGMSFVPSGRLVALGEGDQVQLWDCGTGQVTRLPGQRRAGMGLAFSPKGGTLATIRADGVVTLWDVASRRAVPLPGDGHAV